jgi:hypothetical protein
MQWQTKERAESRGKMRCAWTGRVVSSAGWKQKKGGVGGLKVAVMPCTSHTVKGCEGDGDSREVLSRKSSPVQDRHRHRNRHTQ